MNYLVLRVLLKEMRLFVSRGSGSGKRCWLQYAVYRNARHTLMFGIVRWKQTELRCVFGLGRIVYSFWSSGQRRVHGETRMRSVWNAEGAAVIGMRGLGLHVQLSSRQGERRAGQLEGKGERPLPHGDRQAARQKHKPIETQAGRETEKRSR